MQTSNFFAQQYVNVADLMALQSVPQSAIKDILVCLLDKGIVSGVGVIQTTPPSLSVSVAIGKFILEDGSDVTTTAATTLNLTTYVNALAASNSAWATIYAVPTQVSDTPVVTPAGDTINYRTYDSLSFVVVMGASATSNPAKSNATPPGFTGVLVADVLLTRGMGTIVTADIDQTRMLSFVTIPNILSQIAGLVQDIENIDGALTTIDNTLASIATHLSTLDGDITTINGTLSGIASHLTTLDGEITSINGQIGTINSHLSTLDGEITSINGEISTIQGKQATDETNIGNLQTDVTGINGDITTINGEIGTIQGKQTVDETNISNNAAAIAVLNTFKSAFVGASASNGYIKIPFGASGLLIIQWMVGATDLSASARQTFSENWPIPFPNNCFHVQTTVLLDNAVATNNDGYAIYVQPGYNTTTVNMFSDVGADGVGDTTHRVLMFGIGN